MGLWHGAGVRGVFAVGLLAGVATLVVGQILFDVVCSTPVCLALALAFAAPAAIAGYHAILGIVAIGVSSETWGRVFAVIGAAVVGFTAAARLTLFAAFSAKPHLPPRRRARRSRWLFRTAVFAHAEPRIHLGISPSTNSTRHLNALLLSLSLDISRAAYD